MDQEDSQDDKPIGSLFSRHRSPTFSKEEIKTLVNLIAKYNKIINNKSSNNVTIHAKELAWSKIAKIYNSQGYKYHRNVECLKIKWDNLKKTARKVSKNLLEEGPNDCDELTNQIVAMVCEADNCTVEITLPNDLGEDFIELESDEQKTKCDEMTENGDEKLSATDCTNIKNKKFARCKKRANRSMNFTPPECRILLQCVRSEKKFIFSKDSSAQAITNKRRAWSRVAQNFNKRNPQKRSVKELWNKLQNMKKLAKKDESIIHGGAKHEDFNDYNKLENEEMDYQKIKSEPMFNMDDEIEQESNDADSSSDHNDDNNFDDLHNIQGNHLTSDPLSTIFNGDSGIGSINMESFNSENSEVTKLKMELLRYQLDNAKLERKRIENATMADTKMNEIKATEMALRLRAARLEAVAAAMKLAPAHPALVYTPEELRAQQYIDQYHPT